MVRELSPKPFKGFYGIDSVIVTFVKDNLMMNLMTHFLTQFIHDFVNKSP